jgi:hypothetical protein
MMSQLGHTDPAFTLRVYTHMMRRDPGERDRLRELIGVEATLSSNVAGTDHPSRLPTPDPA